MLLRSFREFGQFWHVHHPALGRSRGASARPRYNEIRQLGFALTRTISYGAKGSKLSSSYCTGTGIACILPVCLPLQHCTSLWNSRCNVTTAVCTLCLQGQPASIRFLPHIPTTMCLCNKFSFANSAFIDVLTTAKEGEGGNPQKHNQV